MSSANDRGLQDVKLAVVLRDDADDREGARLGRRRGVGLGRDRIRVMNTRREAGGRRGRYGVVIDAPPPRPGSRWL
jgi:hypothetical protein